MPVFVWYTCCVVSSFDEKVRSGGSAALREASRFFMKEDAVHQSLTRICQRLQKLGIDYAVAGGMSLVAHGYLRTTDDVDILVTEPGLRKVHEELEGLGYVPPFKGSKQLRDVESGVRIEFLVTGQFPGDGKPKPVAFPEPCTASIEIEGISYLALPKLIELKLASGMTNPGRLRDLADVQELVRALKLPRNFSEQLNPYVQQQFLELWDAVTSNPQTEQ